MKKILFWLFTLSIFAILSGCEGDDTIVILRLENGKQIETLEEREVNFPTKLNLNYYVNEKYKELAKERTYIMKKTQGKGCPCYSIYEVKKVKGGYKILNDEYGGFTIPSVKDFDKDYSEPFTLNGLNGKIKRTFKDYSELEMFEEEIMTGWKWEEIIERDKKK